MPEGYRHLTFDERCRIYAMGKSGLSNGAIARAAGPAEARASLRRARPRPREAGIRRIRTDPRKNTGFSGRHYYTPDALVHRVLAETGEPLLKRYRKAFLARIDAQEPPAPVDALAEFDPATRMLDLRVCDPAMGSGHFRLRWSII